MTEQTFRDQMQRIVTQSQKKSPSKDFFKPYFGKYKNIPDEIFIKMVDWVIDNVNLRFQFPTMFDFNQAKLEVNPVPDKKAPCTFSDNWSENGDPESKAETRSWAKEMQDRFAGPKKESRLPTKEEVVLSLERHVALGEVYHTIHGWIKKEDNTNGDYVIDPGEKLKGYTKAENLKGNLKI